MMYSKDSSEENGTKNQRKGHCKAVQRKKKMELSVVEKMNKVTLKIWAEMLGYCSIVENKNSIEFAKVGEPDVVAYFKCGKVYRVETL